MGVVRREGVAALIRAQAAKVAAEWGRFRSLQRFLADKYPAQWENIQRCRLTYRVLESRERPGFYKIAPAYCCWQLPFCILCVKAAATRRVSHALEKFQLCTPKGQQPRFVHVVQTAPIYDDGSGWGVEASSNVTAFGSIVWETLQEFYGDGIGALFSYQDFGERAFAKRHPHMDLTLSGWMLQDGQAAKTPQIGLERGGLARWNQAIARRATRLRLDAKPGNVQFKAVKVGAKDYRGILAYQMRELVDLRKIEYSRERQTVDWLSYKDHRRQRFTTNEFKAALAEYQWRLGQWPQGDDEGKELHRCYGHLSKRLIRKTQRAMGGVPAAHRKNCPCAECGDWERVFLDDVQAAVGPVKTIRAA